jgi:hypothetical protein
MKFDHKKFFDGVKARIDPTLNQEQVDGLEFLLRRFETGPRWTEIRHIAYALATIFHETAGSFQPVEEGYYLGKRAKAFQRKLRYYPYFGRGFVQLTWKKNYIQAGKTLGIDLISDPSLALEPDHAFDILTEGLFRGWFGGKLTTYINDKETDYVEARRCVNVLDKAGLIAGYATSFEKILRVSSAVSFEGDAAESSGETGQNAPTRTNDPSDGSNSMPNGQPTTPSDNVAVEKEVQVGFFAKIKLKVAGWFAYFGGVETAEKYKGDIDSLGLPTGWIKYFLLIGLFISLIWLIYEAAAHLVERYQKRHRTDSLVQANANAPGKVVVVCPEDLAAFERAGWTVIKRENVVPPVPAEVPV